jgi:hypothetical protein
VSLRLARDADLDDRRRQRQCRVVARPFDLQIGLGDRSDRPRQPGRRPPAELAPIYALIRSGALRSVKIGGSRRISATALSEFIEDLNAESD